MIGKLLAAAALVAAMSAAALADEVYQLRLQATGDPAVDMIYEDEVGNDAVWLLDGGAARFYIGGLAQVYTGRTRYSGWYADYQPDPGDAPCPGAPHIDHLGNSVHFWGQLDLIWTDDNSFVLRTAKCNGPFDPSQTVIGVNKYRVAAPPSGGARPQADMYDFENARLIINVDRPLANRTAGYVSFTKTLPLGRGGASLTVTVQVITASNYHMAEFVTSGASDLDRNGGLGMSMALWPYSSVWNLQRLPQAIYAHGNGIDGLLGDLETKFNGADGTVAFSATGNAARGELVLTMQNR